MADSKISALPAAAALGGTEELPGVQAAANVKITPAQFLTWILADASFTEKVQDLLDPAAGFMVAGTGISLTYSDVGNTLTVAATGGGSLPTGGDEGEVLAKLSSTDGDADWVGPVPWFDAYRSGHYYTQMSTANKGTGTAVAVNRVYYAKFQVYKTMTVDQVAIRTGSANATSGNVNIGIYDSANDKANNLLASTGSTAVPATANTTVTASISATLPPGLYHLGIVFSATISIACFATGDNIFGTLTGTVTVGNIGGTFFIIGWQEDPGSFTLPNPANPSGGASLSPVIGVRSA